MRNTASNNGKQEEAPRSTKYRRSTTRAPTLTGTPREALIIAVDSGLRRHREVALNGAWVTLSRV
jgi:hypothetical protein